LAKIMENPVVLPFMPRVGVGLHKVFLRAPVERFPMLVGCPLLSGVFANQVHQQPPEATAGA